MQTSDRSGIACDHCGASYRNDFVYYSFDFRHITVTDGRMPGLDTLYHSQVVFSLDICTACFSTLSQHIIDNYKQVMSGTRRARPPHICELTGEKFGTNYSYYYCTATKVNVSMAGQPNICTKCQKKTFDADKACSCGNTNYVKPASINTDNRFLEFSLSEDSFLALRKKAEQIRKSAGKWSTES